MKETKKSYLLFSTLPYSPSHLPLPAVVIMCMPSVLIGGEAQYQLLTTAKDMRMIDRGYVFIPYDTLLYSLPYKDAHYYSLSNDTKLRHAYDGVLTITMDSGERNFYEAFKDAQSSYEIRSSTQPEQVRLGAVLSLLHHSQSVAIWNHGVGLNLT